GKLTLAAVPSLCAGVIVHKLAEFQRLYPGVRLSLSERGHADIADAVKRGQAELGVSSMVRPDPDLTFQPLFSDRLMIVPPPGHPLAKMQPKWKSLEKFDLVYLMAGP